MASLIEREIDLFCKKAFREVDVDKSGYIDTREYGEWFKGLGLGDIESNKEEILQ